MPVSAYAEVLGGLDDYVALEMIGGEPQAEEALQSESAGADTAETEPLAEAGSNTFAEALAQEYRPLEGSFVLEQGCRFYIVCDVEQEESEEQASEGENEPAADESERKPPEDLTDTVRLMSSEFAACGLPSQTPLPVVYGEKRFARKGDIVINLVNISDFHFGSGTVDIWQSYTLDIQDGMVFIDACGTDGIWYGMTELLELAAEKKDRKDNDTGAVVLDALRISDGPDLQERALMLDCGRKYFSKVWIENLIRRASLQRYNALILHFAEAEGIRLDSAEFPWMTETIDSLTTDEMKEIVKLADRYHIEVIPSFDTPGHNMFMVDRYAEYVKENPDFAFTYDGKTYDSSTKGFKSIANHYSYGGETEKVDYIGIDLTKEHAVAFTNALIDSYADFFRDLGCSKIDIGSDELLGWYTFELGGEVIGYDNRWSALEHWGKYARKTLGIEGGSASDVLITYINDLTGRLENKGYSCRVFNDEIDINPDQHVELKESVDVTYWFDADNTAGHFAEKGHIVHNFMESWCFYVLREEKGKDIMDSKYKTVTGSNIFDNWDPRSFARKPGKSMTVPPEKMGGGYFAIWCDFPDYKDAATIWSETELKTWANASRMWNPEVNSAGSGIHAAVSYDNMKGFALGMNGFPGYKGDPEEQISLPEAPEIVESTTWLQRVMASF